MADRIGKFVFEETGPGTAYLKLPTHPGELRGARAVPLVDVIGKYAGPYVVFDFDQAGILVGIEIISEDGEEDTGE
ncbi:MAG TPA: hypothetical protein VL025_11945 [Thermoanaerobaculia bacterium]|nr:hypothetical protein [Thermoanaerobaculia bacterium]